MGDVQPFCFDAHSDLLFTVIRERSLGRERVIAEDFLPGMEAGGIDARVAAIYVDERYLPEMALRRALVTAEALHAEFEDTDDLTLATTAPELAAAPERDGHTLVLGMEGAEPLQGDLAVLDCFYRLGLRVLTLTHSRRNAVGDGSFLTPTRSGTPGGLSSFGVEVVERMNERGIVIDVSHLNEPGFEDVIDLTTDPVIASHSNCRSLRDHPRNLTDDQLTAIADCGGVVGLNAVGRFLADAEPTIDDLVDHVEHAVRVAGPDHVGFGFDFVEYLRQYLSEAERERLPEFIPTEGLTDDPDVRHLVRALAERGFDEAEIEGFMGGNFLRVFGEIFPGTVNN